MTVEFVVVFPVLIIVAVIAVNALLFLSECAAFDRVAREAVRVHATSPAYGQSTEQSVARVEQVLKGQCDKEYLDARVSVSGGTLGHTRYTAELLFRPTLFGMGMRSEVFGVSLPPLRHTVTMTVDAYKPGVLL
ncbi:MAG: hypothetical protein FWG23_02705 [Eggerthellaceae bacterium]|nr:hypothetical protein [Eggerthellaceae bacterium]MDR2715310.1 hypothetical protein [Coriobacteriaceae bacterium]